MVSKKRMATTAAATFGAAIASMYAAPELQADIVNLNFNPATNPFNPGPGTGIVPVNISTTGGAGVGYFSQWNDYVGRTLLAGNLVGVSSVQLSQTLTSGFVGAGSIAWGTTSTGKRFVGFTDGLGNHGWFSVNLNGVGGPVTYGPGQYGSMGENVHVGVIPEPNGAGLAMLALGAVGLLRRRKK